MQIGVKEKRVHGDGRHAQLSTSNGERPFVRYGSKVVIRNVERGERKW